MAKSSTKGMRRQSYQQFIKLYEKEGLKAFKAEYTRQRDIVHKQLMRLSEAGGRKAAIGKELLSGRDRILTIKDIEKEIRDKNLSPDQAAKLYASALSNINYIYFSDRASRSGWKRITSKIQQTLKENGYGNISKAQLEQMGDLMDRVYAIYGRKFAPSEEVMEAISKGLGDEMMRMSDADLADFLSNLDGRDNLELF